MRRSATLTTLPFAIVVALALALGIAGYRATSERTAPSVGAASGSPVTAVPSTTTSSAATPSALPSSPSSAAASDAAGEMLRVHNELRLAIAAPAVRGDDRVAAAAQRHAEYLARNGAVGHDEAPGVVGFTGASVRDRLAAQGHPNGTASEVATSGGSAADGVRSLWVLPYHRLGLMHPHAIVAGWGHAEFSGRSATVGVIVYDFSSAAPDVVRSPAAGQRVDGSWDGDESPDVLPAAAARPVGYPLMLVASRAAAVELRSARIADASGRDVAHYVVPQIYQPDYVAIVPAQPLARAGRYVVRLELRIGAIERVEEWTFETRP